MARVLMPLPARDFDPSEAAVSWRVLVDAGHSVHFATPDGNPAVADDILQRHVVGFFGSAKPVAAICHGVLLAARSMSPATAVRRFTVIRPPR